MITTVTAYPSKYANLKDVDEQITLPQLEPSPTGKLYCQFDVKGARSWPAYAQRDIARILGDALGEKPVYFRKDQYYQIGGWTVSNGNTIYTERFEMQDMERILKGLTALRDAGLSPAEEFLICFAPPRYDASLIMNLCNIMEARRELLELALALPDEIQIIIDEDMAFGIPLDAFDLDVIEACACLLYQASQQAASVGKARMQPCDRSNAKYQMRAWLLRLGFIGETFSRPRQTLLRNMDGNSAFFTDESREKANRKRRRCAG